MDDKEKRFRMLSNEGWPSDLDRDEMGCHCSAGTFSQADALEDPDLEPEEEQSDWFRMKASSDRSITDLFRLDDPTPVAGDELDPDLERLIPDEREFIDMTDPIARRRLGLMHELDLCPSAYAEDFDPGYTPDELRQMVLRNAPYLMTRAQMVELCEKLIPTYVTGDDQKIDAGEAKRVYQNLAGKVKLDKASTDQAMLGAILNYVVNEMPGRRGRKEQYMRRTVEGVVREIMKARWSAARMIDVLVESYPLEMREEDADHMMIGLMRRYRADLRQKVELLEQIREDLDEARINSPRDPEPVYSRNRIIEIMSVYLIDT